MGPVVFVLSLAYTVSFGHDHRLMDAGPSAAGGTIAFPCPLLLFLHVLLQSVCTMALAAFDCDPSLVTVSLNSLVKERYFTHDLRLKCGTVAHFGPAGATVSASID